MMDYLKVMAEHLLPPLLVILAGVAGIVGRYVIRWLSVRLGVEELTRTSRVASLWTRAVDTGIAAAEHGALVWAREHGELMPGPAKLARALSVARDEAARMRLPELARDTLVDLIEARLGDPSAPGQSVSGEDAVHALRAGVPPALLAILVLILPATLGACTTGQLQAHVTAARLSSAALDGAATIIEAACSAEESARMGREGVSPEAHEAHVTRCTQADAGHELARHGWLAYVDAVLAAALERRPSLLDVLAWARQLAGAYVALAGLLEALGVDDVPPLPTVLAGGGS